jgi:hypothetical protein
MHWDSRREDHEIGWRVDRLIRFLVDYPEALVPLGDEQVHQLQPVVSPHVSHFKQVPFRTIVKLEQLPQQSPV